MKRFVTLTAAVLMASGLAFAGEHATRSHQETTEKTTHVAATPESPSQATAPGNAAPNSSVAEEKASSSPAGDTGAERSEQEKTTGSTTKTDQHTHRTVTSDAEKKAE
ncbi:MAG: hypothetical protein NZ578_01695 [Candidatus Binatia bacterium]|nr:hypothetical protein [Candidatus Binatia bacterium]